MAMGALAVPLAEFASPLTTHRKKGSKRARRDASRPRPAHGGRPRHVDLMLAEPGLEVVLGAATGDALEPAACPAL
eukprot:9317121-Pyramimonas_sp.AAC.1